MYMKEYIKRKTKNIKTLVEKPQKF